MKQVKSLNILYLISVILIIASSLLWSLLDSQHIEISLIANLIVAQGTIVAPGLIFILLFSGKYGMKIPFNSIKVLNVFLIIIYTELWMPLVTSVNVFSQLFTSNAVIEVTDQMTSLPLVVMVLIAGIIAPFCEELVFRGIFFFGLKNATGRIIGSALTSALFFGLMHLNLNQLCYAFVIGIVFAVTDEILGSIWPSVIMHCVINSQNVLMVYVSDKITKMQGMSLNDAYSQVYANEVMMKTMTLIMGIVFLAIAIITTLFAILLLYAMCGIQKREEAFKSVFSIKKREIEKNHLFTIPGYIAIAFCVFVIFLLEPLLKMLKVQ